MRMEPHAAPVDEVLADLETSRDGLTSAEAARRLARFGPNRLQRIKPVSIVTLLLHQLKSVVAALLVAAALVALAQGDRPEAIAIASVLLINTAIGFMTELRARRAMEGLMRLDASTASVVRNGETVKAGADAIVPGDVLLMHAGSQVPADARVLETADLRANEAALTGESMPVSKAADAIVAPDTALGDRRTMLYKGTTVVTGAARAVVTATGASTELGKIGTLVASVREERTPLEVRLDALGRRLIWIALAVAALVAALGALQGAPRELVFQTGIALAIAAVPEALPTVVTIALAVGMRRMARRHALVRRLPAVETLGSTTVVCTDKTLTLTTGEMSLARTWTPSGGARPGAAAGSLIETGVLASSGDDPLDLAILRAARDAGIDAPALQASHPQRGEIPFSTQRKLSAAFRERDGQLRVFVKGAPERVLSLSEADTPSREAVLEANAAFAADGLRVLAFASGVATGTDDAALTGLTFEGLAGFVDPPAAGVREAIATLKRAGLATIMITGDQRLTAEAIARDLGIDRVHSRVSPEDKLRIVEGLQKEGAIVAMLGDGVNDAPALRRADVGVAMGGRGTDVAKEAAAIVLRDDRFATVAAAVEEGRVIYANIRKFVFYLFSCNLAEVLVLLVAGLAGWPLPLQPLQLLWLNILTDTLPALALAVEPADHDVMQQPPRDPREALLSRRFFGGVLFYAALITAATLAAFAWALSAVPDRAGTVAFMTLAFAQVLHLGNARSSGAVIARARALANPWAFAAAAFSLLLQMMTVFVEPLRDVLRLATLGSHEWLAVAVYGAAPALIGQAIKAGTGRGVRQA